jgi:diguanylate cyclase (GGDEF)-like protein
VGDPLYPIWAVYFFINVGVAFFYYAIVRFYAVWLLLNYAMVGMALQWRGLDPSMPHMLVAGIILLMGVYNLIAYTGGERRLRRHIAETARTDPLTNLLNRRGLEEALRDRLAAPDPKGLAVLMLDIDRFKRYNDQFGHLAADGVLEQLGEVLLASVRDADLVARYGGDEFVVMMADVTAHEAVQLAERLRQQVARLGLCTVSIGVSVATSGDANARNLLDIADAALLLAKQAGRNCVRAPSVDLGHAA